MADKDTAQAHSFGDLLTQWEREFNSLANQVMGTEGFGQAMNTVQSAQTQLQKTLVDGISRQRETFNLPTREDVLRIGQGIKSIERRLEQIEEKLSISDAEPTFRPAPPRTKQPPAEYLKKATS
ncbi:MAG: hypothetical protein ACR2PZ_00295 [Pseudomonadales bacterium]